MGHRTLRVVLGALWILAINVVPIRADTPHLLSRDFYHFPPADELPVQDGMPDPFVQSDGTRMKSQEEWPQQREYLKAMLAHYQYGHMPPRPKAFDLQKMRSEPIFDDMAVKEQYAIELERNGKRANFHFEFIRPAQYERMPVILHQDSVLQQDWRRVGVVLRHAIGRNSLETVARGREDGSLVTGHGAGTTARVRPSDGTATRSPAATVRPSPDKPA